MGEVRRNLDAANKEIAKATQDKALTADPEVKKLLASIQDHHKKAGEMCDMADEHVVKGESDTAKVADCCTTMLHELESAEADFAKLMKKLGLDKTVLKELPARK